MSRRKPRNQKQRGEGTRELSSGPYRTPETGQRTPQPDIRRWVRKNLNELELSSITQILRAGELGDVEALADLWLRMLKTDAQLASVWETRMAPVYSARWEVAPDSRNPHKAEEKARTAADGCREALAKIHNLETVFSALLNARGLGYAVCEIIWKRGYLLGQRAWVPSLKPIHSRRFRFADSFELGLYDSGMAARELESKGIPVETIQSRGAPLVRLPAGKYLVHQPTSIADFPTSTGLVFSISRWYWVKQIATKLWLSGAEAAANPRFIGRLPELAPDEVVTALEEGLENLAADGVIVLRGESDVEISEGKAVSSAEVWLGLVRTMDAAIAKAVLGSTLNVEIGAGGGNRAAAESQALVTIRPRQMLDASQMWATIQRCLFRFILEYNPHIFGHNAPVPVGRSVLVEERSTIDQIAIDSGRVKVDELRQSRGLMPLGGELGAEFINPITRAADQATSAEFADSQAETPKAPSLEPAAPTEATTPVAETTKVSEEALNGAQVASLQQIIQAVASGELPAAAAIEIVGLAFPSFPRHQIETMVNSAAIFDKKTPDNPTEAP